MPYTAYRTKLKLNNCQATLMAKHPGFSRWVYNRRVASIRNDAIHKITWHLAKNHSRIVIENLNVVGLLSNHKLASAIQDCGFGEFRCQLDYKCQFYGAELVVADRFYPSSQICSCCGHQQKMPLAVRVYDCPVCGLSIDRDLNAAIILSNWGRLPGGSLLRDNRSHASDEAENKPQCPDKSGILSVL